MSMREKMDIPRWHRELECYSSIKSTLIIEGNIFDRYLYPMQDAAGGITQWQMTPSFEVYLDKFLRSKGYDLVVFFDTVDGFHQSVHPEDIDAFRSLVRSDPDAQTVRDMPPLEMASRMARAALKNTTKAIAIILNIASRYLDNPGQPGAEELTAYTRLLKASMAATVVNKEISAEDGSKTQLSLNNLLVILPNKTNDIPAWFYLDNPNVKTIMIPQPGEAERRFHVDRLVERAQGSMYYDQNGLEQMKVRLCDSTDGFSITDLLALQRLALKQSASVAQLCESVSLYKYGISENPWDVIDVSVVEKTRRVLMQRVKGQDLVIERVLDIIKRSIIGLSGLQHSSGTKPKGVLFFAGPTGTGKTQTAKALAEGLFRDETKYIRFDMSEYGQSQSDQKLFGAPPGYIGYESGGQLTNAVKQKPFSVLLFDEIEKAHPSVMDKFLQILEDGRMTDGQGKTVYFSDSIIIFTSNLGIVQPQHVSAADYAENYKPVSPAMPHETVRDNLLHNVRQYFTHSIGRPELLNRFGNNIVTFDYIRPQVAEAIYNMQTASLQQNLRKSKGIRLEIGAKAGRVLKSVIGIDTNGTEGLSDGGRGVGNVIESHLINPLSRYIFDNQVTGGCLVVEDIVEESGRIEVICREQGA